MTPGDTIRGKGHRARARPHFGTVLIHYTQADERSADLDVARNEMVEAELATELYLAEGKGREKQWKYIVGVLEKLGLSKDRIEHLRKKDDPRLLAQLVEELMAKQ